MGIIVNDGDSKPVNLADYAVLKHGNHNQKDHAPHGSGTRPDFADEPKKTGRNIQDLSPSSQKEFIARMSAAKTKEEARAIIEEFTGKLPVKKHGNHDQSSHGSWANGGGKGLSSFQQRIESQSKDKGLIERVKRGANAYYAQQSKGVSFRDMERDYDKMEQAWREKDIGDPQDLAEGEFRAKYGASLLDIADFVHGSNLQLEKSSVEKHGNHDQRSHGRWSKDDSEGEFADKEGLHPKHHQSKDESEGEFADRDSADMEAMDEMDLRHPPKPESYYQERTKRNKK